MSGPPAPPPGRHQVGTTAHPGTPIAWLAERGFDGLSVGTDGFGKRGRQGILFSANLNNPNAPHRVVWNGQFLAWDGENLTVEDA